MDKLENILNKIEAEHPYRVPGNQGSYSQYNEGWTDAVDRIRGELGSLGDRWIPVEERLPEDEEMVLVTCQTKSGKKSVNRAWYGYGFWHGTGSMSGVIAWRPLPEPYRPEQTAAQRPEWQERMLHTFLGGHK